MFHRAVDAHAQATPADLSKQLFPSSSPIAQFTATSQTQRNAQHARGVPTQNTLRPSQGNALNTNGLTKRPISSVPVKRTSNGLAKVFGGSSGFNDKPQYTGSQANPVLVEDGNSKVQFDENDFDSDLDLDIEDPSIKGGVHYPTPPPVRSAYVPKAKYSPVQKASLSTYANVDSGYKPEPPPSSIPMPWSSSPVSHTMPPPATNKFSGYAYTAANVNRSQAARPTPVSIKPEQKTSPTSAPQAKAVDPRAPKRRTLPWLQESAQAMPVIDDEPPPSRPSTVKDEKRMASVKPEMTPRGKVSEQSAYPWNTTASAVKEQQKLLRKANQKKLVKENEATVESKAAAIAVQRSKTVARPHLSQEQRQVLKMVVDDGKSVFFTGSAGTGKSVLLREIIAVLRKKHSRESDRVAMTASTGLAACNIGGVTLHSFAGIGLGKESVDELIKKIKRNQKAKHRWMRTKVLIVDEVSMVDGELFDKLEEIGRRLRNNGRPFGGIQLVITGDFFQLPPVPERGREARFAFDAKTWDSAISHTIGLKHVFRQKDPVFAEMLNEMREGRLSQKSIAAFRKLDRPLHFEDDLAATELFPTRGEVENANTMRMKQLSGEIRNFDARDGGSIVDPIAREKLLQNCMAPQKLELKKGSQVMLIKNIDEMLVNGSLGKVIGFMDEEKFNSYSADPELFEQARESDDEDTRKRKQKIKQSSLLSTTSQSWPLVRFAIADGTTRDLLCQRELWKVELPNGEVQASRAQVPLILAWALSIHKAQGQTLERVKVDLGKVFEKGQAYVALSRATNMAGLQVSRFDPNKVLAHDKVRTFYAGLSAVEQAGQEDIKMKPAAKPKVKDDDYDY